MFVFDIKKYDIPKDSFQAEVVNGQFGSFVNLPNNFESLIKSDTSFLEKMSKSAMGINDESPQSSPSQSNDPDDGSFPSMNGMRPSPAGSNIDKESSSPDYYDQPASNFDDSYGPPPGAAGGPDQSEVGPPPGSKPRQQVSSPADPGPMYNSGPGFHSMRTHHPPPSQSFSGHAPAHGPYSR